MPILASHLKRGMRELLRSLEIDEAEVPFLSHQERPAKIRHLLSTVNKHGELPNEAMSLVEDESFLGLFEENLSLSARRRVLTNSLYALQFLAQAWDGRRICRHASIPPLLSLYEAASRENDLEIMQQAVEVIAAIDSLSNVSLAALPRWWRCRSSSSSSSLRRHALPHCHQPQAHRLARAG